MIIGLAKELIQPEPVEQNVVKWGEECLREAKIEVGAQLVAAEEVAGHDLEVVVSVGEAYQCNQMVRMRLESLIGEDGEANEGQCGKGETKAGHIQLEPDFIAVIRAHRRLTGVAIDRLIVVVLCVSFPINAVVESLHKTRMRIVHEQVPHICF